MAANAAIYFHEEGYRTDQPKLMGRHAAGEGFLKGFLAYAEVGELVAYAESEAQFQLFGRMCEATGGRNAGLPKHWAGPGREGPLARAGTLMLPGPGLAEYAWRRRRGDPRAYAICGVTHTTASHRVMDGFGELLTGPVEPWDAVICTSQAVRVTIGHVLDRYADWLKERLGATLFPRPLLPVIPLGVDCAALAPTETERLAMRRRWRERLRIGPDDVVALFVGRLSWHAKAHPLPMYAGLEQAARRHGMAGRLHLIEAGWHANDWIRDGFLEAQKAVAPSVRCHAVDGRDPAARREIWHAADLFCTFSDNIQETYGLTPVEAMAAGLPVVASDWNGYRDTLVHGETALLVPTAMPEPASGMVFAERHEDGRDSYDHYCAQTSLVSAVEVGAAAEAIASLVGDPDRRRSMGEAGRQRARTLFDWQVVVRQYQELWAEQAAMRAAAAPSPALPPPHPLRDNPFALFGHYPTRLLGPATRLRIAASPPGDPERLGALRMNRLEGRAPNPSPVSARVLERVRAAGRRGLTQAELLEGLPAAERQAAALAIGWLMKLGLIE
jgi:glycosyltransferase involved in cell wall biosynthesis